MEEYVYKINDFLPIDFGNEENNDYRRYIVQAYIENVNNSKYQFAYLAFHLLFMAFIYKGFWILKISDVPQIRAACSNNKTLADIADMFDMSILPERQAIESTMTPLGFHINQRSDVQLFVDTRDKCAHASGIIQYSETDIVYSMSKALDYAEKILVKKIPHIKRMFIKEVKDFWASDKFKYALSVNFAENLICSLKFSPKEIEGLFEITKDNLVDIVDGKSNISQEISYYMIMSVLQCRYIDSTSTYNLKVSEKWLYDVLFTLVKNFSDDEKMQFEVELEDELNESEKYGTVPYSALMDAILKNEHISEAS